jgi:glycosyltransferase involved in cell wall biosynthesis
MFGAGVGEKEFAVQLARLMDDPVLRSEMGQRGRNRVQKELAWQYSVPRLLAAYDKLATKSEELVKTAERPV